MPLAFTGPASELRFDSPGSGFWELDPVHFPRPATRYWSAIHPPAFQRGTGEFARSYGMLIDSLEMAYVNGFAYKRVTPLDPAEVPERFARAEAAFAQKVWRQQLRGSCTVAADRSQQIEGIGAGGLKPGLGPAADGVAVGEEVVKPALHGITAEC